MNPRTATWLAWYMCVVSLTLMALGLFLLVLSRSPVYADAPVFDYWLVNTIVAVSFSTVGGVIAPRLPPRNPIGWIFCTIGLFVFLALLFPDGRPPTPRWRPFGWFVAGVIVVGTVSVALWPETAAGFDLVNHPLGIEVATDTLNPVETLLYGLGLVAMSSMLVRLRRSKGVERHQIKWFAYAVTVLATSAILAYVVSESMGVVWLGWVSTVLVIVSVVGLPAAVGIAILRYRLYNIDVLINRTLVYGSLTAVLVAVYLGGVVLFQELFRTLTGQASQLGIVASTLAIAALFNPLRHRIQGFIDRRFYRRKYDARKTLEAFSSKLREETDLDTLSDDLEGVIRETMQPSHVSLWLRPDPILKSAKRSGEPRG